MSDSKKFYWLKLKRDFFKRHDIRIVEAMPNGKDYILFYLKLLLESIDHEGALRFSDTVPYNEQMLSVVTDTNIDIVRSAMKLFLELNMMTVLDDKTIYMTEVNQLIGSETRGAQRKREQRLKWDNVPRLSQECPTEIEKDKEKDKETETEVPRTCATTTAAAQIVKDWGKGVIRLTDTEREDLFNKLGADHFKQYINKIATFITVKGAKITNHYCTVLKWFEEDKSKGAVKSRYGDFDPNEAMQRAIDRSYRKDTEDDE
jgi:predicted phage replisome organizer